MAKPLDDYTGLLLSAEEISALTNWPDALVEDYGSISTSLNTLSNSIADSVMIVGTGSPEGSVTANESRQYYDTSGGAGSRFYVNSTVGANTGWVAIN